MALFTLIVLQNVLTEEQLYDWGWRVPFFIGSGLALLIFLIRRGMAETESFKNADRENAPKSSALSLFKNHPKTALAVIFLTAGGTLSFMHIQPICKNFWSTHLVLLKKRQQ